MYLQQTVAFKDHFSQQTTGYAKFRPQYPRALFEYIASVAPNEQLALDCATGNGQAALALTEFFENVIAIDASERQIASAPAHPRLEYRVAPAEATGLTNHSCDVITVAQALHWLDLDAFYPEARRVLKSGGVLAVWSYNVASLPEALPRSSGPRERPGPQPPTARPAAAAAAPGG